MISHISRPDPYSMTAALRYYHVDCGRCISKGACCNFSGDYPFTLEPSEVRSAFSREQIRELIGVGGLRRSGRWIELTVPCPHLSQDGQCEVYDIRAKLGLICMIFPIYVVSGPSILVDYRCPEVQRNWHGLSPDIQRMGLIHSIPIQVKFSLGRGTATTFDIEDFDVFRRMDAIPPQTFS